jgi:hypothetical protein
MPTEDANLAMMRLDHASKGLELLERDMASEDYVDMELDRLTLDLAELASECGHAAQEMKEKREQFVNATDMEHIT